MQEYEEELSLGDLFHLLRRGLLFALIVASAASVVTFMLSRNTTPEYESTLTLLSSRPGGNLQGSFGVSLVTAPPIDISAYAAAATSNPVLMNALEELGVAEPHSELLAAFRKIVVVKTEASSQSSLLRITVRDADREVAASSANAIGSAMLAWDEGRATSNLQVVVDTLTSQIKAVDDEIAELVNASSDSDVGLAGLESLRADRLQQLNAARALRTSAVGSLEILEPALPSLTPTSPRPVRNAAVAFVLGIFLVYGIVLLRQAIDARFRNSEDLQRVTELPVLGEFPRLPYGELNVPHEAANYLRANVMFSTATDLPKILLVTSANPGEGKTSVAIGLATSFARNDYKTLLLDADLRKPRCSNTWA